MRLHYREFGFINHNIDLHHIPNSHPSKRMYLHSKKQNRITPRVSSITRTGEGHGQTASDTTCKGVTGQLTPVHRDIVPWRMNRAYYERMEGPGRVYPVSAAGGRKVIGPRDEERDPRDEKPVKRIAIKRNFAGAKTNTVAHVVHTQCVRGKGRERRMRRPKTTFQSVSRI